MSIGFYMDVNVRAEITSQLRARDVDLLTSEKDGTREFSDTALLDRATALGRVLFPSLKVFASMVNGEVYLKSGDYCLCEIWN